MTIISYYFREFESLDNIIRKRMNFDLEEVCDYNSLLQYKKHINYLEDLLENEFKSYKKEKSDEENNNIYKRYLSYNNKEGMRPEVISLYLNVKEMRTKYLKLKINS